MNKLTKVVNIYPSMPITGVNPPIRSTVKRVTKSVDEIRTCLMARATVEEILSDGNTVRLDIANYDKNLNNNDDTNHPDECACGCGAGWRIAEPGTVDNNDGNKSPWQIAYENALKGKNLASMTRKQRRSAEAAAKAVADAAVATSEENNTEIIEGAVEPAQEAPVNEPSSNIVEEVVETTSDEKVEEPVETAQEEEVETIDVETIPVIE